MKSQNLEFEQVAPHRKEEFLELCLEIQRLGMDYCPDIVEGCLDLEKTEYWLNDYAQKARDTHAPDFFIFKNQKIVGIIGFAPVFSEGEGEVGFWVAPQFQRQGIAREALAFLIQFGFEKLDLNRVELMIHPENGPSNSLAKKCGLKRVKDKEEKGVTYQCYEIKKAPEGAL